MDMQTRRSIKHNKFNCVTVVELQRGGRLFTETGSSNISAVNWDISPKSGMLSRQL